MARKVRGEVVIKVNDAEVKNSLNGVGKEIRRLKKEINDLDATDVNYAQNLKKLTGELDVARKKYGQLKDNVKSVGQETAKLPGVLKQIGPMIAAAFSVTSLIEFGRMLSQNITLANKAKKEMAQLTGQTGSRLANNTAGVMSLADTYQQDSSKIMQAANAMSKQMKIPFEEAFEVIKKGFEDGVDISGEMLDNIKEYAPFMAEAKISAEEMMGIIETGAKDGIYSDKSIDAVKEFTIRMREGTKATQEALKGLGLDVEDMYQKIESGQMSYFEAMKIVSKKLEEVGEQSKVTGTAIADIFGGPGEDAGYQYLSNLHKIGEETKIVSRETQKLVRERQKEYETNLKLNNIWTQLSGAGSAYNLIMTNIKANTAEWLSQLMGIRKLQPSDDIHQQRVALNQMKNELINVNTTNERRKELIHQIQALYPDIFKNLDLERASNLELAKAIDKTSDALNRRYKLQSAKENVQSAQELLDVTYGDRAQVELDIEDQIFKLSEKYSISIPFEIQEKSVMEQAVWLSERLKGVTENFSWDRTNLKNNIQLLEYYNKSIDIGTSSLTEYEKALKRVEDSTPFGERIANSMTNLLAVFEKRAKDLQQTTPRPTYGDISAAQKELEKAREARRKAEEQEKKRREQINNEILQGEKKFYDELLRLQREFEDSGLDLLNDGFQKEKALIDNQFKRRIEDLKNQIVETERYQKELEEKSKKEYKARNTAGGDGFQKLANDQVAIAQEINGQIENVEKLHLIKLSELRFKYQQKEFEDQQKADERILMNLETRQKNKLKSLTDLESAKKLLADQYQFSDDELNKIKSFEKAKEEIILAQQKETIDKQLEMFQKLQDEMKKVIDAQVVSSALGIPGAMSPEEIDELILKYEELGNVIANLISPDEDENAQKDKDAKSKLLSGIDLLGFTADDWALAFESLDEAETKLQKLAAASTIVKMGFDSMTQALGMFYDSQNRKIQQDLQVYEASINRKKVALANQLEQGIISQETYNAKVAKLEADLEKKRAEAEYKQAMNEWKMQMIQAVGAMALGILNSLSYGGPVGIAFAAVTAALGAFQIATLASNKPKKPSGYYDGGPTSGSGQRDAYGRELADGPLHANEYVIPEYLRKDPVIARMEEFIEARRRGFSPNLSRVEEGYADGGVSRPLDPTNPVQQPTDTNAALVSTLEKMNGLLEYLVQNPIQAEIADNVSNGKKLDKMLNDFKNWFNKAKR